MRPSGRADHQLRVVTITRNFTAHAEGSVLIEAGDTRVICNASLSTSVPRFLRGTAQGWVTAEYGMLPRATGTRSNREAVRGRQDGRSIEIQRLIGRALRCTVDLQVLGERSITLDCDVIQADGGTRTAAITGASVALADAIAHLEGKKPLETRALRCTVAAVAVGMYQGRPVLDLDYAEDAAADTDMNLVMTSLGGFVEIQGTAEGEAFDASNLDAMLDLGRKGIAQLLEIQQQALGA